MSNQDYEHNPLYSSEQTKLQAPAAAPALQYRWDLDEAKWVPNTNEDKLDVLLKTFSGQLSGIHVEAKLDHDTVTHEYLNSISGSSLNSKESLELLISSSHSGVDIGKVVLDGLTVINTELGDINTTTDEIRGDVLLTRDYSQSILIESEKQNLKLESISGTLTGISSTAKSLDMGVEYMGTYLTYIDQTTIEQLVTTTSILNETKTANSTLSGISGELSSIEVHVSTDADTRSHELLSGISGELSSIEVHVSTDADTKSHELLSGISGELSSIDVHVSTDADTKSHELLSGISGQLSNIEVGVTVDSDEQAHALLNSISGNSRESKQSLDAIHTTLEGELTTSDAKSQNILLNLSGQLNTANSLLGQEFTKETDTFTEDIEADHIILECPDLEFYGSDPDPQYGVDRDILDDLFNKQYKNGRNNPNTPEENQYFLLNELAPENRPKQRKYSFDTEAEFALKLDSFKGNSEGAQRLSNHNLQKIQNVTILNDSIYPIKIYCQENDDKNFYLYDGHSASIDNINASDIMVKRDYTISGFSIDYTITYLKTVN